MASIYGISSKILLGPSDQSPRLLRFRLQLMLTVLLVGTNVIGAGIVFGLSFLVTPGDGLSAQFLAALAIAVPTYVVTAVLVGASVVTKNALRTLRWVTDGADPSMEDRRAALRLPWRMTLMQFALWFGGLVIFTALAAFIQADAVISTFSAVGIAGLVVSAFAYLITEFLLRPVASRALKDHPPHEKLTFGVERKMILLWCLGSASPVLGLIVAAFIALTRDDIGITRYAFVILGLALIVLIFGFMVTVMSARAVVAPIESVQRALARVGRGDLDVHIDVDDGTELGLLQAGFNEMAQGLRERERIRDLFGRHVGESVAAAAAAAGDVELGGETRVVSVLMIDLVGSTTYATHRDPAEVVTMLNRFFGIVVDEIEQRGGLVNKFMGDAGLAIFGAPTDLPDHAAAALAAARTIARRIEDEMPEISVGIGVSTGQAVAGNVGASSRFEYTVIGDAVNSAARLEELAKQVPGRVLAATATVEAAGPVEAAFWEPHADVVLRGRDEPTATSRQVGRA